MKRILFYLVLILSLNLNLRLNAQCTDNTCECVYSLLLQEDTLWIGTKVGLYKYNIQTGDNYLYNKDNSLLPSNFVYCLTIGRDNSLWIGTYGGGLVNFKNGNWVVFDENNSQIGTNNIFGVELFQEILWLATDKGVVTYGFNNNWILYDQNNSLLPPATIYSVANDGDSAMWVSAHGGLYKYNGNWTEYVRYTSGLPHTTVYSVTIKDQVKYICTLGGLACFDGINWSSISSDKSLTLRFNPGHNDYWLGTTNGLKHFLNDGSGKVNVYNKSNTIMTHDHIQAFIVDSNDTKWIGTWGGGLYKLSNGQFTKIVFCNPSGVNNVVKKDLSIYPNPTENFINVDCDKSGISTLSKIEIYNLYGQLMKVIENKSAEKPIKIDVGNLESGMYLLKIYFEEKTIVKTILKR